MLVDWNKALDYWKAIDIHAVAHGRLIKKLTEQGMNGEILKWLKQFPSARKMKEEDVNSLINMVYDSKWSIAAMGQ